MHIQSMDLSWIVVKDLKEAVRFYTEVVGLKLIEIHEQFGWAELQGHEGGSRLGIAQQCDMSDDKAGQNACVTLTVANLDEAKALLEKKMVRCVGPVQEVPGHVRLQMVVDPDGNRFQLVEKHWSPQ